MERGDIARRRFPDPGIKLKEWQMERTFREYVDEVKRAAHGRWPGVLTAFGIPAGMLVNRHGPCPLCGGTDRFRFDDRTKLKSLSICVIRGIRKELVFNRWQCKS